MPAALNYIPFDHLKAERLEKAYNEAVEKREAFFDFEGNKLVTDYAKYVLEYLRSQGLLPKKGDDIAHH